MSGKVQGIKAGEELIEKLFPLEFILRNGYPLVTEINLDDFPYVGAEVPDIGRICDGSPLSQALPTQLTPKLTTKECSEPWSRMRLRFGACHNQSN